MAAVDTVFEQLGAMSVLELVELKKKIEDEWGITAAAAVAVAAPMTGLVTVLQGTISGFVRALDQVAQQRAAAGEA